MLVQTGMTVKLHESLNQFHVSNWISIQRVVVFEGIQQREASSPMQKSIFLPLRSCLLVAILYQVLVTLNGM